MCQPELEQQKAKGHGLMVNVISSLFQLIRRLKYRMKLGFQLHEY